jgi:hypothetical protein
MSEVATEIKPENQPVSVSPEKTAAKQPSPAPSPAEGLRKIQNLLVMGIFPGQFAPTVVESYTLLEQMALKVEADAVKENKA